MLTNYPPRLPPARQNANPFPPKSREGRRAAVPNNFFALARLPLWSALACQSFPERALARRPYLFFSLCLLCLFATNPPFDVGSWALDVRCFPLT